LQRKLGPEDGDDPEKLARKLAYYGIAEPAMAHLPLAMLSSSALWLAERGILKEKRPAPQRDFLPLLSIGEDVVSDIDGGKGDRLVKDAMEFAGYLLGLPTVQVKRIVRAAENGDVYGAFAGERRLFRVIV
jgi:hypothetical protein